VSIPSPNSDAISPQPISGRAKETWRSVHRSWSGRIGLVLASVVIFFALAAPVIAPFQPNKVLFDSVTNEKKLERPCIHLLGCAQGEVQHLMGLDINGRDYFSRIVYGTRVSLGISIAAVLVGLIIGTLIGLVSGFFGGRIDNWLMRTMEVLLAFPSLLLAILIVTVLGRGLTSTVIAIGVVSIPVFARIVRGQALSLREQDFVAADRALGVSNKRLMFHRILPNTLTPLTVQATLGLATAVLETAGLGFLGLGAQPPLAEWGSMLALHRGLVFSNPYLVIFPGIAILINVLGFNLLGDALRDALDPRTAGRE
jgi:peptide/nickel transport system permease protein